MIQAEHAMPEASPKPLQFLQLRVAVGQTDEEVIRRRAGMIPLFSVLKQGGKSAG